MKKVLLVLLALFFSIYVFGCGRKQQAMEELQEPMSMEALSALSSPVQTQTAPQVKPSESVEMPLTAEKLEPLPPAGPYKPTSIEIQTALKGANFYTGAIDGKVGSMTRKAIEEFQKANGLKADGKVGIKTWAVLSKYLNPEPLPAKTRRGKIYPGLKNR
jgi:murein L,D-transpeptidase YcbB/YkuD